MFAELGVPVLDLDQVGRGLAVPGSDCLKRLVSRFGEEILHADGSLDRARLAAICFDDEARTRALNAIMHPLIRREEEAWLSCQDNGFAIIEASVLIESGGVKRMDAVIVVLADLDLRKRRVLKRGRQDEAAFRRIIARQCDDATRRRVADYVIENNSTLEDLRHRVREIHDELVRRFG